MKTKTVARGTGWPGKLINAVEGSGLWFREKPHGSLPREGALYSIGCAAEGLERGYLELVLTSDEWPQLYAFLPERNVRCLVRQIDKALALLNRSGLWERSQSGNEPLGPTFRVELFQTRVPQRISAVSYPCLRPFVGFTFRTGVIVVTAWLTGEEAETLAHRLEEWLKDSQTVRAHF
jgi:hypothetical protein